TNPKKTLFVSILCCHLFIKSCFPLFYALQIGLMCCTVLFCRFLFSCINKKLIFLILMSPWKKAGEDVFFHKKNFDFLSGEHYRQAGSMSVEHFRHLVEISSINSRKVICALEDFFVHGMTRKEACDKHKVAQGYFSISMRKFIKVNNTVSHLTRYYVRQIHQ
ncbi:PapB/FocB family fimbrial expression transcriptional regulator, partial [Escherichia coli]|nr:PapB/FocB family fimbrial expression transcriptional regulator [Escherichia coli]